MIVLIKEPESCSRMLGCVFLTRHRPEQLMRRVVSVNTSPSWAWCLHSVDSVSSEASPWRQRESFSPPKKLLFQLNISRTHWRPMKGGRDEQMKSYVLGGGWTTRWRAIQPSVCPACTCCFGGPPCELPELNYSQQDRVYKKQDGETRGSIIK